MDGKPDIAIASDHTGVDLKLHLVKFLLKRGHNVTDMGVRRKTKVDYPDYAKKVARAVADEEVPLGILICGSGIGMSIVANRYRGVRAALVHDHYTTRMAKAPQQRQHPLPGRAHAGQGIRRRTGGNLAQHRIRGRKAPAPAGQD